jgi:hypothetical protein
MTNMADRVMMCAARCGGVAVHECACAAAGADGGMGGRGTGCPVSGTSSLAE